MRRKRTFLTELPFYFLLAVVLLWSFFPILYITVGSFRLPTHIWDYPPKLTGPFTLMNYKLLAEKWGDYFINLKNSLIVTVFTGLVTLLSSVTAAFTFSRYRTKFLRVPAFFLIAVRMIPPIVITIPIFPLLNALGLVDRYITLVMLYSAFLVSLTTWIMKSFIDDIPVELEEAATIDGCSRLGAFFRITFPLAAPGFATVVIFAAIFSWNEYLFALIFTSWRTRTAPITIAEFTGAIMGVDWGALLAASIIHLFPMLILLWVIQRHLVRGMQVGAIK
jgi:multiple sugar transport system permease protein